MKKLLTLLMLTGVLTLGYSTTSFAQVDQDTTAVDSAAAAQADSVERAQAAAQAAQQQEEANAGAEEEVEESFHRVVLRYFIDGGWEFMSIVLLCLILGLAISIERIITLNLATTNTKKLLAGVEDALASGGVDAAKDYTAGVKGPVASIFTQGLMRSSEGIEMVEKSVIAYGSVEMGKLERGLVWISLFISLAPMLGFMGTVIGMIQAFDTIEALGDIQPAQVAGGIKVALLTTVAGLIVAVILQLFYNYLVSKVDSLVNDMEDASISLVDMLVKHKISN
ncbi:MotA/TolQ/ExbB proton channel family protein [Fulvivirgaceae bacterium BMA10]|uniref:MotA/TolQ/ExbB proton channel family protein n=1 Tax=Splendidivirga corallicola TaxID=3051826 RepID=A0ABT8KRU2_9BACT|nr:MotA/TolQ/ExbB proton channel family protein [Fulvivirgaceae bacterium BMA10]